MLCFIVFNSFICLFSKIKKFIAIDSYLSAVCPRCCMGSNKNIWSFFVSFSTPRLFIIVLVMAASVLLPWPLGCVVSPHCPSICENAALNGFLLNSWAYSVFLSNILIYFGENFRTVFILNHMYKCYLSGMSLHATYNTLPVLPQPVNRKGHPVTSIRAVTGIGFSSAAVYGKYINDEVEMISVAQSYKEL